MMGGILATRSVTQRPHRDQFCSLHLGFAGFPPTYHPAAFLFRGTQEGGKRVETAMETRNGVQAVAVPPRDRLCLFFHGASGERRYCTGGSLTAILPCPERLTASAHTPGCRGAWTRIHPIRWTHYKCSCC